VARKRRVETMSDQTINGNLDVESPGSAGQTTALTLNVQSFGTVPNKQSSFYITATDVGAQTPPDFAVNGYGYIYSPTITVIWDALAELANAIGARGGAKVEALHKMHSEMINELERLSKASMGRTR
jgi:hypothetical protein